MLSASSRSFNFSIVWRSSAREAGPVADATNSRHAFTSKCLHAVQLVRIAFAISPAGVAYSM